MLKRAAPDLPLALVEGLAEVFSSIEVDHGQFFIGAKLPEHIRALANIHSLDAAAIFGTDRNSPTYNEQQKMWAFYAQSWALSHMLLLGPNYAPRLNEFLAALSKGRSVAEALRAVYGADFVTLDRDLKRYVDEGGLHSVLYAHMQAPPVVTPFELARAQDTELNLIFADLVPLASPQCARIEAALRARSQRAPADPAVEEALGYLAMRKSQMDQARLYFGSAVNHGLRDGTTILLYAELQRNSGASLDQILPLLSRAVAADPANDIARLKLGWTAAKMEDYSLAISALSEIKVIPPQQAFVYSYTLAYSYLKCERLSEGLEFGSRAKRHASTVEQQRDVEQLLRYADRKRAVATRQVLNHPTAIGDGNE